MSSIILDTGPLVASVKKNDKFHPWVKGILRDLSPPFITCESVISEAGFLLRNTPQGLETLAALLKEGLIQIDFDLQEEIDPVTSLLMKYQSVPMSLADACLVRMTELYRRSQILTLDGDFYIYRKHANQKLDLIAP